MSLEAPVIAGSRGQVQLLEPSCPYEIILCYWFVHPFRFRDYHYGLFFYKLWSNNMFYYCLCSEREVSKIDNIDRNRNEQDSAVDMSIIKQRKMRSKSDKYECFHSVCRNLSSRNSGVTCRDLQQDPIAQDFKYYQPLDTQEPLWKSYFGERQMILFLWKGAPINATVNLHAISSPSRLHSDYRRHSRGSPQLNKILDRSPRFGQGIIERRVVVAFWNLKPVKAFRSLSVVQILLRSTWATSAFETRDDAQELLWRSYFGERQMILFLWRGAPTNALVNPYLISSPSRLHIDYRRHSRGSPQLNKIFDRSPRFSQGSSRGASSSRSSVRDPCHPFGRCPLSRFFYACLERILRRELTKNLLWWVPPKCRDLAWSFLIVGILRGRVAWRRPAPSR